MKPFHTLHKRQEGLGLDMYYVEYKNLEDFANHEALSYTT
jgi:hypothetical protein